MMSVIIVRRENLFYVHGSVYRESVSIIVQQDATIHSLLFSVNSLQKYNKLYIVAFCWTIIDKEEMCCVNVLFISVHGLFYACCLTTAGSVHSTTI